jgi:hypothetical protein
MGMIARRIWRALGVLGLICIILLALAIFGFTVDPALLSTNPQGSVIFFGVVVLALARLISQILGYQRPLATRSYNSVVPGLLTSTEEFCLILRPFGADGEVFLRQYKTTRSGKKRIPYRLPVADLRTMEQVLAVAVEKTAKQKMYALVDQKRELAPPGPVYVRAPDDDWQEPIRDLMRRAYAVILWLPPDQDLRPSFNWEIEQIVLGRRQTRTIIVLPPPDHKVAYQRGVKQAAALLAAMETTTGKVTQADPLRVQHYEGVLGDNTITAGFSKALDGDGLRLMRRYAKELPRLTWQQLLVNLPLLWLSPLVWDARRKRRINAVVYESGLSQLLAIVGKELANQPFSLRYPSHEPGSRTETAAHAQVAELLLQDDQSS